MLALIYGSTGVMSLSTKTEYIGGKIELRDVSETSPSEITGLVRLDDEELHLKYESQFNSFKNSDLEVDD